MYIVFIFLTGLCIGSFINVLESRIYKGEDILKKPSHCDFCKKNLHWIDMIPVLSWIMHGGRSRCCRRKLSWQYPVVEFMTGLAFVLIYLRENIAQLLHCFIEKQTSFACFGQTSGLSLQKIFNNETIFFFIIFIFAFTIFLQDLKYQAIHGGLLKGLLIITAIYILFSFGIFDQVASLLHCFIAGNNLSFCFLSNVTMEQWNNVFFRLLVAFLSALPFYIVYKLSKETWLGEGDVWIVFWMGLFLGFPKVFWAMYFGIIVGGIVSAIVLLLHLKKMRDTISLGPFLLVGVLISLLWRF